VLNHNVTVRSGPSTFHSRTQAQGSYSHVFTRPGTYALYCTIHPSMKMTVVVR
jgi:plastocyanin